MKIATSTLFILSLVLTQLSSPFVEAKDLPQALKEALKNNDKSARATIGKLLKQKDSRSDLLNLTLGRVEYQSKNFQAAILAYDKVSKDSDYWVEAIEEKAWAHLLLNDKEKALAQIRTLLAPLFVDEIGPEPYFLAGYIHLSLCNYSDIFTLTNLFKDRLRPKLNSLKSLSQGIDFAVPGQNSVIAAILDKKLHRQSQYLPRYFYRDLRLNASIAQWQSAKTASAKNIYRSAVVERMKSLAQSELKEISRFVQKFHILEAEVIQRMHLFADVKRQKTDGFSKVDSAEYLVFPDRKGEYWLDELGNYDVDAKNCPSLTDSSVLVSKAQGQTK